jgi:CRP-like cAMP-binding protein
MFNVHAFLHSPGPGRTLADYKRGEVIFRQGESGDEVFYLRKGGVRLTVLSKTGRQGVIAMLGAGQFFGEGSLTDRSVRNSSAKATDDCSVLIMRRAVMESWLTREPALAGLFIAHLLARNTRIEDDLVDQLFNCSEKRLARTLLLLARYGMCGDDDPHIAPISQETLAEMVGTTRSRINVFMKKFERLGFIEYSDGLKVNRSLWNIVLHD